MMNSMISLSGNTKIPPQVTIALESGKTATIGLTHFLDHDQIINQYISQKINKIDPLNIKVKLTPFSIEFFKDISKNIETSIAYAIETSITYASEISKEEQEFRVINIEF
ncbi:hypothetical protein BN1013_02139 [Candidatus Rubidus massiliensis]|nr:hypothetical protein BN1013_02139 [Candidatus Rubidus massiliensis]